VILWHLVAAVLLGFVADLEKMLAPGKSPSIDGAWDPRPPAARSRGPPLAHDLNRQTARLARTGTCPIHHDPSRPPTVPG